MDSVQHYVLLGYHINKNGYFRETNKSELVGAWPTSQSLYLMLSLDYPPKV